MYRIYHFKSHLLFRSYPASIKKSNVRSKRYGPFINFRRSLLFRCFPINRPTISRVWTIPIQWGLKYQTLPDFKGLKVVQILNGILILNKMAAILYQTIQKWTKLVASFQKCSDFERYSRPSPHCTGKVYQIPTVLTQSCFFRVILPGQLWLTMIQTLKPFIGQIQMRNPSSLNGISFFFSWYFS